MQGDGAGRLCLYIHKIIGSRSNFTDLSCSIYTCMYVRGYIESRQ